jgi:hypothetical protein
MGGVAVQLHSFLTSALDGVTSFTRQAAHTAFYTVGNGDPLYRRLCGSQRRSGRFGKVTVVQQSHGPRSNQCDSQLFDMNYKFRTGQLAIGLLFLRVPPEFPRSHSATNYCFCHNWHDVQ